MVEEPREVPPAMPTKGLGWSGRDPRPAAPPLGPGARAVREPWPAIEALPRFRDLADPLAEVPEDAAVDPGEAAAGRQVEDVLAALDRDLVALHEVKRRIREIAALLVIDRCRRRLGLEARPPTLHMCFTGNPGTGKTTVARRMGEILHALGYLRKGHLVTASRDDLVGQYVGHTAPKTREVIRRAMGGVLFIDEAYHIYRPGNERDYGQETVEILLEAMEDHRADLVVILAGYKAQMDRLFSEVPGLSSRIAHHLDFPDFGLEELLDIARRMAAEQRYRLSPAAEEAFLRYLEERMRQPRFANGRSVRNALDRARMRHAARLYEALRDGRRLAKRELVTIEPEDILASRVFTGGAYAGVSAGGEG